MADEKISGIYEIVNTVDGKRYVGSAVSIRKRWKEHRAALSRGDHANIHLRRAWIKHGEDSFLFRVIEHCDPNRLIEREQLHIDAGCDYNICPVAGSTLGREHSEDTRQKIAAKAKGRKRPPRSDEHRARLSEAIKKRPPNPERVAKMAATKKGRKLSDEHRAKIAEATRRSYENGNRNRDRPEDYRAKISETLKAKSKDQSVRSRMSKQAADAWSQRSDQEKKDHTRKMRASKGPITEEYRRALSERMRGTTMHPNARAALLAANKGRKENPDTTAARAALLREWWTPERKAKRAAEMRERHAKRRSEQEALQ